MTTHRDSPNRNQLLAVLPNADYEALAPHLETIHQGGQTVVPLSQRIQGRDLYAGPMAVLIDAATASSSELLAGGLQMLGRAPSSARLVAAA